MILSRASINAFPKCGTDLCMQAGGAPAGPSRRAPGDGSAQGFCAGPSPGNRLPRGISSGIISNFPPLVQSFSSLCRNIYIFVMIAAVLQGGAGPQGRRAGESGPEKRPEEAAKASPRPVFRKNLREIPAKPLDRPGEMGYNDSRVPKTAGGPMPVNPAEGG